VHTVWYPVRLRWNTTEEVTGEQYRAFLGGFSIVGTPSFTYGVSSVASFGLTAINPDISDLFVEKIQDGKYLTANGEKWEPLHYTSETIKVRFGSDVKLDI